MFEATVRIAAERNCRVSFPFPISDKALNRLHFIDSPKDDNVPTLAFSDCDFEGSEPFDPNREIGRFAVDPTLFHAKCYAIDCNSYAIDAALRLICQLSSWHEGGLLLHAASFCRDNRAFLALAPSGGGKSTLSDLASDAGFTNLSDETAYVCPSKSPLLRGTIFRSTARTEPKLLSMRLSSILILEKSHESLLTPMPAELAARSLLAQHYRQATALKNSKELLRRVASLCHHIPAFRFSFPKHPSAIRALEDAFFR